MPDKREEQSVPETDVTCLYCGSTDVEMIGLFGAFHLASQYFCRACHSPFGRMRWQSENPSRQDDVEKHN